MARPKDMATKASSKSDTKVKSTKDGRVSKHAANPKTVSKEIAATTASKVGKADKKNKKAKKAPTPPPESSSESESESDDDSASEVSSTSESESEAEVAKAPKANGSAKPVNGASKAAASKAPVDDDDSEDDSSDASGSDSESDEEAAPAPAKAAAKTNGKASTAAKDSDASGDSDSSEDSEASSDSDEEESAPAKAGATLPAAVVNGADDSAESDEDSDDSDSDDSEDAEAPAKKRKADADDEPASKKVKTGLPANATKNLFVGNLTWSVDDEWLHREFSAFGECSARVMTDRESGRSKGFGFVEFTAIEDAIKAHDAQKGTELDGRAMNVDYATPRGEPQDRSERTNQRANKFGDSKSAPSDSLFVGNISFDATAEMLQEAFEEYGTVTRVHLPTDPDTGALKGFGHIGMGSIEEATAAHDAMNGVEIAGRALRLDYATPRQENGGGFRGGRGGGRGGRGDFGGFGGRGRGDFGGRGRGGFNSRGGGRGRGGAPRGRGASFNRGGFGNFSGQKTAL